MKPNLDNLLGGATAADHVRGSYEIRLKLKGWHVQGDKDQHFRDAMVATAEYLGRPLTTEEVLEATNA